MNGLVHWINLHCLLYISLEITKSRRIYYTSVKTNVSNIRSDHLPLFPYPPNDNSLFHSSPFMLNSIIFLSIPKFSALQNGITLKLQLAYLTLPQKYNLAVTLKETPDFFIKP